MGPLGGLSRVSIFRNITISFLGWPWQNKKNRPHGDGRHIAANFAKTDGQEMGFPMAWWPASKVISQDGLWNKFFLTFGVVLHASRYVGGCVELIVCVDVWCGAPGP